MKDKLMEGVVVVLVAEWHRIRNLCVDYRLIGEIKRKKKWQAEGGKSYCSGMQELKF